VVAGKQPVMFFAMIVALTCLGLIFGATIGHRHRFFYIVPPVFLTCCAGVGFCIAGGFNPWLVALTTASVCISLQIGYLTGVVLRIVLQRRVDRSRIRFFGRPGDAPRYRVTAHQNRVRPAKMQLQSGVVWPEDLESEPNVFRMSARTTKKPSRALIGK
jgi:hypothetical protein